MGSSKIIVSVSGWCEADPDKMWKNELLYYGEYE